MAKFLEGWLFRPQGKPMPYPVTMAAKHSQFPWRHYWHECSHYRYSLAAIIIVAALYRKIDRDFILSDANHAFWREKRKRDHEHHKHMLEKEWEVRT